MSDNSKLAATAAVAAVAGAAIAVAAMKFMSKSERDDNIVRHARQSYIFDDPLVDEVAMRSDSLVMPHNHEEKMRRRIAARVAVEEENLTPRNSVTVRIPATSANFGPGCKFTVKRSLECPSELTTSVSMCSSS